MGGRVFWIWKIKCQIASCAEPGNKKCEEWMTVKNGKEKIPKKVFLVKKKGGYKKAVRGKRGGELGKMEGVIHVRVGVL